LGNLFPGSSPENWLKKVPPFQKKTKDFIDFEDKIRLKFMALTLRRDTGTGKRSKIANWGLPLNNPVMYVVVMSAVAEIESAIERLSPAEIKELAAWFDDYQQMVNASAEIFSLYDQEEKARL
jgi:hypothetical protein